MNASVGYYQILGVLQGAEQVVITDACRTLVSMDHPDKWKGDKAEAKWRMAEINVAYEVLGDPIKPIKPKTLIHWLTYVVPHYLKRGCDSLIAAVKPVATSPHTSGFTSYRVEHGADS